MVSTPDTGGDDAGRSAGTLAGPAEPPAEPVAAGAPAPAHDAFISYSRRDAAFAARLQQALEKYTPPSGLGLERRRLRVFRDQHDFTGTDYYDAIQRHLAGARKLIVVCSPDAAASPYVGDEIERFVALHGADHLVPVLWRGIPNNESTPETAAECAFPPALARALEMPLAADFRGRDPRSRRFLEEAGEGAWMLLLANLLDVSRAEIERRELRRRRRTRRIWTTGVGAVIAALLALSAWALFEGERALARQLAAEAALAGVLDLEQVERRVLLARESVSRLARLGQPALDAETALRESLAETPRRRLALPAGVRTVAFSADGNHLLVAEGRRLRAQPLERAVGGWETSLERPLGQLEAGADHRFILGLDNAGAVRIWTWADLQPLPVLPREVAAAPVHCVTFAHGGASVVALRLNPGGSPGAELLHWRPGESELLEQASATLTDPLDARPAEGCLRVRRHSTTAEEVVVASLRPLPRADDAAPAGIVLGWPLRRLRELFGISSGGAPVRVWRGVLAGEADQNASAVLLLPDGRLRREAGSDTAGVRVVPQWSSPQDLAAGGAWLATSQGLEDPYVPLLKSTRFDVVDTSNGAVTVSVGDHGGWARFTPDASTLVTVAGARLRLWDRRDGHERLRLFAAGPVEQVLFDPSSRHVAAIAADGALEVFDVADPDETLRAAPGPLLAPLGGAGEVAVASGRELLLTGANGSAPRRLTLDAYPEQMQASPDGAWIALLATREPRAILLGDPPDAELLLVRAGAGPGQRWRGPAAQHLRFDRASRRLLTVDEAGAVRLLDLAAAAPLWERQLDQGPARTFVGPLDRRYGVALSDDGTVVAVGSAEGLVVLSGADGRILRRDTVATPALALSADGRLLARLDGDDGLSVQRTADGRTVARLDRRAVAGVRDLVFSPGGRRLMAIGGTSFGTFLGTRHFVEEHLVVWELESGRVEVRLPDSRIDADDYQTSIGARADERRQLSGLVWNPLSREAAGILYPSMLAYWTVPSGMVPGRLTAWRLTDDGLVETYRGGARNDLTTLGFAASGGALLVGGEDGYTRVIDLSRARLLRESCRAVRRDWTEPERRRHLGVGWRRPARCGGRGLPADSAEVDAPGPPGARASPAPESPNPRLR